MSVTRMAGRRRPSRSRSQLLTPSRSARSTGGEPQLLEPGRRCAAAETGPTARRRPRARAASTAPRGSRDGRTVAAAPVRDASTLPPLLHGPGREVGRADVLADAHVAPDARSRRDDRALAHERDARVEACRLRLVGGREVVAHAHDRVGPDRHVLVEDRAVHDGAGPDVAVEHDHAVAHDGARVDAHARRQDRALDGARDEAAVADEAAMDARRGPDARRRALLRAGVDDPASGRTGRAAGGRRAAPSGRASSCRRCPRPASSRRTGSRTRGRRRRAWPG